MTDRITPETIAELRRHQGALLGALATARENAHACGDGADGDSIAFVCDYAEAFPALLAELERLREGSELVKEIATWVEEVSSPFRCSVLADAIRARFTK